MQISYLKDKGKDIFKNFGVIKAYVFGSLSRCEFKEDSDVDLLVYFEQTPGLIKYVQFIEALEDSFNVKFDVLTEKLLPAKLKPYIENDLKAIYEYEER